MQYEWRKAELIGQLLNLGVTPGGVLLVHSSFRSVRPLEDGPLGLIEALRAALGPGGTLVMPSWSGLDDEPFDPATSPVTPDLGVVSDTFWRLPNVKRSAHPFAFAAAGPQAEQIISDPLPLPPHSPASPVARVHELDGQGTSPRRGTRCQHDAASCRVDGKGSLWGAETLHHSSGWQVGTRRLSRE